MRRELRHFRKLTGLTAVTSLATPLPASEDSPALWPQVHPRCARRVRSVRAAPCGEHWPAHVQAGRQSPSVDSHTCPLGLRCSCVPIQFGGRLIGVAKLVVGPETSDQAVAAATGVLKLIVAGVCQELLVAALSEEVETLRQCVAELRQMQSTRAPVAGRPGPPAANTGPATAQRHNLALVECALSHLHQHYQAPALSLTSVARVLGCNPRYLTSRFTMIVGEHMHAYLVRLRVAHACRLLMDTGVPVKEAAYESGFRGSGGLARAFRQHVGVSPGEYQRIVAPR